MSAPFQPIFSLVRANLPLLRFLGIAVALGVALIPSLELAIGGALLALTGAWVVSLATTVHHWQNLPGALKGLVLSATLTVTATYVRLAEAAVTDGHLSIPSWADAVALPAIIIGVYSFWMAARARSGFADTADLLDATAVALIPVGLVVALTSDYLLDSTIPGPEKLLNITLLIVDGFLLVVMGVLIFGPGTRDRPANWLAISGVGVATFDLVLYTGYATNASWQDESLRAIGIAITCYAISTTYSTYPDFAKHGTRPQRYRSTIYGVGAVALPVWLLASVNMAMPARITVIVTTFLFLTVAAFRVVHANLTARRFEQIVDAQSSLAQALAEAETPDGAAQAATEACQRLLGTTAVTVGLQEPDSPVLAATERVWVGCWTAVPSYLHVAFDQIAQIVDLALDSIEIRTSRVREQATVEATTDTVTGWRNQTDFKDQGPIIGVVAVIDCPEVSSLVRSSSVEEAESLMARIAVRVDDWTTEAHGITGAWRGEGSRIIVTAADPDAIASLLNALSEPYVGISITPTFRIGAVESTSGLGRALGLERARMALDHGSQGDTIAWYSADLQALSDRRWAITSCFRRSLSDPAGAGFTAHYQGIVDAQTGFPVALEALARWVHPTLGPISPGEFIPIAEEQGLVDALDRWMLDTALDDLDLFRSEIPTLKIHVNMSPSGRISDKLESLAHTIRLQHADKADALVVELTESAVDERGDQDLAKACERLRSTGAGLALDDFGTGQSNLARVARLPFSEIKLGRDFAISPNSAEMLAAMVPTIKAMGLPIVAENVETAEQADRIRDAGVDWIQGYLYSKPSTVTDVLSWVRTQRAGAVGASVDQSETS